MLSGLIVSDLWERSALIGFGASSISSSRSSRSSNMCRLRSAAAMMSVRSYCISSISSEQIQHVRLLL